jgi:hypothetical protein
VPVQPGLGEGRVEGLAMSGFGVGECAVNVENERLHGLVL